MARVPRPNYMSFPLRITAEGPRQSERAMHVREQIEQTLLTDPGERVFRPEYGVGLRALVFEPGNSPLWAITQKRLMAALMDTLQGEVDPKTIRVELGETDEGQMFIEVGYTLAALGLEERHRVPVPSGGRGRG